MNRAAFSPLVPGLIPLPLPGPVDRMIETVFGFRHISSVYDEMSQTSTDGPISERLLRKFEIKTRVAQQDLSRIPGTGPVLIVVNHPFGILDGAVLAALLASIRGDVKILANELLVSIPEVRNLLIPVDTLGGKSAARKNSSSVKTSIDLLVGGGLLVAFPAGEVSHFQWRKRSATDSVWNPAIAAILRMAHRLTSPFVNGRPTTEDSHSQLSSDKQTYKSDMLNSGVSHAGTQEDQAGSGC